LTWPLVTVGPAWARVAASLALLAGVLASRLLLLPDGPWEQDEALIACGVVDFDPSHHMPLPPGFPLWILLGRLVRVCGVADPLVALQVASAALSVLAMWATVAILEGLVGRGVALTGALLAAFLPGVWFHAGRGFSETAAAAFALLGLAVWMRRGEEGFVLGVGAMTAAALVRPPLAPWFAVAVLLASWGVRRSARRLAAGAALSLAVAAAVLAPLVAEAGGWELFWGAGSDHATEHFALLGTEASGLRQLGFTVGAGGGAAAAVLAMAAAIGWLALRRRLGWRWWAGSLAAAWLVFLLVALHNRTYPRYWVLAWLVAAPLAVHGVAVVLRSRRAACGLAVLATAAAARAAWPAMTWIHSQPLPVVAALRVAASEGRGVVVFDDGLFSFRNLAARQGWLEVASMRTSEIPRRRLTVGGDVLWFLSDGPGIDAPATVSAGHDWSCGEPSVVSLSQHRFLAARLVRNPVLVWRGGAPPEQEESRRFVWCSADALLLLPPLSGGGALTLGVEVHQDLGPVVVRAAVDGHETAVATLAGKSLLRVPVPALPSRNALRQVVPVAIRAAAQVELAGDRRQLAYRVFSCSVEAPPFAPAAYDVFPEADAMLAEAVGSRGLHLPELIGEPRRPAVWLGPEAVFDLPLGAGEVVLELLAPRPGPVPVTVRLGSVSMTVSVPPSLVRAALPVPEELVRRRRGELIITSEAFVPGPGDPRLLGVALSRIAFVPEPGADVW